MASSPLVLPLPLPQGRAAAPRAVGSSVRQWSKDGCVPAARSQQGTCWWQNGRRGPGASPWSLPALPSPWAGQEQHLAQLRALLLEGFVRWEMLLSFPAPQVWFYFYPCDPGGIRAGREGLSRLLCLG